MAACLMLSGVGKSGSPAPKSTTSTPSRRRRSASAETFIVEETLMVEIRSAISAVACMGITSSLNSARKFRTQAVRNDWWHKLRNIATKRYNLFDHAGAEEGIFFGGHEKNGLGLGPHPAIEKGHLEFRFIVRNGTDA